MRWCVDYVWVEQDLHYSVGPNLPVDVVENVWRRGSGFFIFSISQDAECTIHIPLYSVATLATAG
jgi:hypothetical protein